MGRVEFEVQLRLRGKWVLGTTGTDKLPSKFYLVLKTAGAPRTVYRMRVKMDEKNAVAAGTSPWRYWRLR